MVLFNIFTKPEMVVIGHYDGIVEAEEIVILNLTLKKIHNKDNFGIK